MAVNGNSLITPGAGTYSGKGIYTLNSGTTTSKNNIIGLNNISYSYAGGDVYLADGDVGISNFISHPSASFTKTFSAAAALVRTGAATPAGAVDPYYVGEMYVDTTAHKVYVADGLTNANWNVLN